VNQLIKSRGKGVSQCFSASRGVASNRLSMLAFSNLAAPGDGVRHGETSGSWDYSRDYRPPTDVTRRKDVWGFRNVCLYRL
jgi:hypothetical protein